MEWLGALLGLAILLLAGDLMVRGAVNLALRIGVPALLVSLTIVAFGTSAPELLIAIDAVLEKAPGLALGNVVGSNTANVLLVLGVPAFLKGYQMAGVDTRASYVTMLGASLIFIAVCFAGPIIWVHGLFLLAILAIILGNQAREALAHRRAGGEEDEVEGAEPDIAGWKIAGFLILGLIGLPLGAHLLVESATDIAEDFGVSEAVIGLTLVALGTSLPELSTTLAAAYRRQADVAIGNVIGSNMFNLLGIIGVASFFGKIRVEDDFLEFDLWVMLAASLVLIPFVFFKNWDMTKRWGLALTIAYIIYVAMVVFDG